MKIQWPYNHFKGSYENINKDQLFMYWYAYSSFYKNHFIVKILQIEKKVKKKNHITQLDQQSYSSKHWLRPKVYTFQWTSIQLEGSFWSFITLLWIAHFCYQLYFDAHIHHNLLLISSMTWFLKMTMNYSCINSQ